MRRTPEGVHFHLTRPNPACTMLPNSGPSPVTMQRTYSFYRDAFRHHVMPFAYVDLELFDQNARDIAQRAGSKPIRVASKSIRCVPLIERILASDPKYRGIMAYSVREAVFLSHLGLDDLLIGYPVVKALDGSGLAEELLRGKRIVLMVDCVEHVDIADRYARQFNTTIPLCIDLDMSIQLAGFRIGVLRSPIATPQQAVALCRHIAQRRHVRLEGLMGYEAQVAGLPDHVPQSPLKNSLARYVKRCSVKAGAERRARTLDALRKEGFELSFVNGGGTGSVETTAAEDCVSEVTVGSGFFSPVLFDWYAGFHHLPAAGYAIEITRIPGPGVYTCHGGGYVASGVGRDKQPRPYLPAGASLTKLEGAGEVQTPVRYAGPETLQIGDPIFMRYSKAGEMCERFNCLLALDRGEITEIPTYRGEGQSFV